MATDTATLELDSNGESQLNSLSPTGSGWLCTYHCNLHSNPIESIIQACSLEQGFIFQLQVHHYLDIAFTKKFMPLKERNHVFASYLLPSYFKSKQNVERFVSTVLNHIGAPNTDQDLLINRLLTFDRRNDARFRLVPLCLDFKVVIVLRDISEAYDWYCGGTMDSVPIRTLRATKQAIEQLRKTKINATSSRSECAVCLREFGDGELVTWTPCSHGYHEDCIQKWLTLNHRCPICRFSISWVYCHSDLDLELEGDKQTNQPYDSLLN